MLNLAPLKIKNDKIKQEQRRIYRKIYYDLINKININAESGRRFCLFRVPEFILDSISYPFDECIEYLNEKLAKLRNDKYINEITFYQPNVYYIKWSI
jgi:hypothetical protein